VGKLYVWVGELPLTEKGHQVSRRPFFNAPLSGHVPGPPFPPWVRRKAFSAHRRQRKRWLLARLGPSPVCGRLSAGQRRAMLTAWRG
jgi:hypothetical protein